MYHAVKIGPAAAAAGCSQTAPTCVWPTAAHLPTCLPAFLPPRGRSIPSWPRDLVLEWRRITSTGDALDASPPSLFLRSKSGFAWEGMRRKNTLIAWPSVDAVQMAKANKKKQKRKTSVSFHSLDMLTAYFIHVTEAKNGGLAGYLPRVIRTETPRV